jgi:glucokinase
MTAHETDLWLGVDLGGTDIKAVAVDESGRIRWACNIATRASDGRDAVVERLLGLMTTAEGEVSPARVHGVGYAIPGVLDPATGTVELLTNFTPDWTGFGLRDALERGSGMPISMLNDVRAATVAEQMWGAGRQYRDFVCIAIGTGIGGGLVLNGELYFGSRGAAGEIGHQTMIPDGPRCNCGNYGCLEALASGYAIAREAREAVARGDAELAALAGSDEPEPQQVAEAARRGSAGARAIFENVGTLIGRGLGNVVCALNPEAIIVGGGISRAGDLLLSPIRGEIERRTVVFSRHRGGVEVVASPLGGQGGAIGAAAWALRSAPDLAVPSAT